MMDQTKTGSLICKLRKEKGLTQQQLATQIGVSDKAVSKWERGLGCPEVSLLPQVAGALGVDMETLLAGTLDENERSGGNMKKLCFYVCPGCGNVLTAATEASVSCCGKRLKPLVPKQASEDERLQVELVENEFYITSGHPMEREHHIAFVALLTGDALHLRRQYPEWDLQARIPRLAHGRLLWYCTQHGLFEQRV